MMMMHPEKIRSIDSEHEAASSRSSVLTVVRKQFPAVLCCCRGHLLFCIRVSVAAIVALMLAQYFVLPLHGLWVVLTATVVTQTNIGSSVRAVLEYFIGTLGGAVYAGVVGLLVPHSTEPTRILVLAVVVAPAAFAAALNPHFRVAPFSAALVLLISGQLGEGPIESAAFRLLEVLLGGAVALIVSVTVFPERAHRRAREIAAGILDDMASALPEALTGLVETPNYIDLRHILDRIERAMIELQGVVAEINGERPIPFLSARDPTLLLRTFLRLRDDCLVIERVNVRPLPTKLKECIGPDFDRAGTSIRGYFHTCALALRSDNRPRQLQSPYDDLSACVLKIAELSQQFSADQLEQISALSFMLKQLGENITELERDVQKWAPCLLCAPAAETQTGEP